MNDNSFEVFISYRREDTSGYALGLRSEITRVLPEARVFLDVDSIDSGMRWRDAIRAHLESCHVMLVVIGDEWLRRRDGMKKIDREDDPVRLELKWADERNATVIPVLVEEASMPSTDELPADVRSLCEHQAHPLHDRTYGHDVKLLIERLAKIHAQTNERPTRSGTDEPPEPPALGDLPSRVTQRYLEENVPGMGREQLLQFTKALHERRWSDDDIYDYALSYSALTPPKRLPGRITTAWLAENVPLMKPDRVHQLVAELRRRRWTDDEISRDVLAHHPAAAITEIPSRISPKWLQRNASLMLPDFKRRLAQVLLERGWTETEIHKYLPGASFELGRERQ